MAEESRWISADKLQGHENANGGCTLVLHRKNARGGEADTRLQSMQWPARRRRGRCTLTVLDMGLTKERRKTASTAPHQWNSRMTTRAFHQPELVTTVGGGQAHQEREYHAWGNASHGALCFNTWETWFYWWGRENVDVLRTLTHAIDACCCRKSLSYVLKIKLSQKSNPIFLRTNWWGRPTDRTAAGPW